MGTRAVPFGKEIYITPTQVKTWFQNHRFIVKRGKMRKNTQVKQGTCTSTVEAKNELGNLVNAIQETQCEQI